MFSALRKLFTRSEMAALTQRRRQRRFTCHVPVLCSVQGDSEPAVVVDMAEGGLRLMIRQKVKAGSDIELHYNKPADGVEFPAVRATVMWSRRSGSLSEVGVLCPEDQLFWVPMLLRTHVPTPNFAEVRQTVRFSATLPVSICIHFGPAYVSDFIAGHIADLSLGGAAFYGPVNARIGTEVHLRLEPPHARPITVKGTIVRQLRRSDGKVLQGIRFVDVAPAVRADLSRLLVTLRDEAPKTATVSR